MSRIDSNNINVGESFVIKIEKDEPIDYSLQIQAAIEQGKKQSASLIQSAEIQAEKIIQDAKMQAEQEAHALAEEIKDNAQKQGYEAGYKDGYDKGATDANEKIISDFAQKVNDFNNFIKNSFEIKKRIIKSMHMDMINLVLEICNKICHSELELNQKVLSNITKAAIIELKDKEDITVIVNPLIRDEIIEIMKLIKEENSLIENVKIIEDNSISADGCIVESLSNRIDSRISSQIAEITQKLLNDVQSVSEEELVKECDDIDNNINLNNNPEFPLQND